jgi:hypothetical protein
MPPEGGFNSGGIQQWMAPVGLQYIPGHVHTPIIGGCLAADYQWLAPNRDGGASRSKNTVDGTM